MKKAAKDDFIKEIKELGGRCFKFKEPDFSFSYLKQANIFFSEHFGEYVAIHCHALFSPFFYGKVAKKHGINHIIVHAHSSIYGKGILRKIRNWFFIRKARRIATEKVACSAKAGTFFFGKKTMSSSGVLILNNAIDCKKYIFNSQIRQKIRKELNIADDTFLIGHVGGFSTTKNHVFMVDLLGQLRLVDPKYQMVFVGGEGIASGSTLDLVKEKTSQLNLKPFIHFLGLRKDVFEVLMAFDLFLFPSIFEGLPISLVEAQASGLHCVVSKNVTKEVDLGACSFIGLDEDISIWVSEIISVQPLDRPSFGETVLGTRFNIVKEARTIEAFYLSLK